MALLVLILLGATLGWLASILARTEAAGSILKQMGLAILAAIIAGWFSNTGSLLDNLSLMALGIATIAIVVALIGYHAILTRGSDFGSSDLEA